jgi:branched-chain amino acid transport system permease protein
MGPLLGRFEFDLMGADARRGLFAGGAVDLPAARRLVHSPFGATLMALRDNRLRAMAIGIPVSARLAVVYTVAAAWPVRPVRCWHRPPALPRSTCFHLERGDVMLIAVIGGAGWLYGGIAGAVVFKLMHDVISGITPQYWTFWIGLFLVVLVLVGRERLFRPWTWFGRDKGQA